MSIPAEIRLPTRIIDPALVDLLKKLTVGQRIKIVQALRVGARKWNAEITGTFRGIDYLATGVTTDRVPEDDVIVPVIHFTKDNGEMTSVTLDEHTMITMT